MNSGIDKRVANIASHIISEDLSLLPIGTEPAYLEEGFVGLCTGGSAVIELFDYSNRMYRDDMIVILPLQFASLHDRSADFPCGFQSGPGALHGYHERCVPDDARFLLLYAETFLFPFYGERGAAL